MVMMASRPLYSTLMTDGSAMVSIVLVQMGSTLLTEVVFKSEIKGMKDLDM